MEVFVDDFFGGVFFDIAVTRGGASVLARF